MPILDPISNPDPLGPIKSHLVDYYLLPTLGALQKLEVYDELGMVATEDAAIIRFGYGNWSEDHPVEVRKRTNTGTVGLIRGNDYIVNNINGEVTLLGPIVAGDEIRATYTFQYFLRSELGAFLDLTLNEINSRKHISGFAFENAPLEWDATFILGTYIRCLQRVLLDTHIWYRRLIFADPAEYKTYLKGMLDMAKDTYETNLKSLKRRAISTRPMAVSTGKYFTQQIVDSTNFRKFTVLGASN